MFLFLISMNNMESYVEIMKKNSFKPFSQEKCITLLKKTQFGNLRSGLEGLFVLGLGSCQSFYRHTLNGIIHLS